MLAERLHLSGIITMVVFAMAAARRAPDVMPARIRIPSWAVWEVAVFVLNVLAFILVGFQLKSIAARASGALGARYAAVAAAVCAAVILARIAWVTGASALSRWRCRPRTDGSQAPHDAVGLSARAAAVVGWCGMRGTVTLAAALALPTGHDGGLQLRRAEEELAKGGADGTAETPPAVPSDADARVVHAATGAQRRRLVALRADGTIGVAAFQRLEEELDWAELGWAQVLPPEHRARRP
jgi:hypothetical protein